MMLVKIPIKPQVRTFPPGKTVLGSGFFSNFFSFYCRQKWLIFKISHLEFLKAFLSEKELFSYQVISMEEITTFIGGSAREIGIFLRK